MRYSMQLQLLDLLATDSYSYLWLKDEFVGFGGGDGIRDDDDGDIGREEEKKNETAWINKMDLSPCKYNTFVYTICTISFICVKFVLMGGGGGSQMDGKQGY